MTGADRGPLRAIDRTVQRDSAGWGIPPWLAWPFLVLPFAAAAALVLTVPHPRIYHFLIEEDHVIEWAQFVAILAAAGAFAVAARRSLRQRRLRLSALFVLVASGAFVVAGEEISWGQRI